MNAQGHDTELDGGLFGFTLPMGFIGWIVFVVGIIIFAVGIVIKIPMISAIGILLVGFSTPSELQVKLHKLRKEMRPGEVAWQSEMGGTELISFWGGERIHRPEVDLRSWVFPAPPVEDWHLQNIYSADSSGKLIAEHPNKIGTPIPPTFSNAGLSKLIAFCLLALQLSMLKDIQEEITKYPIMLVISIIWLVIGFFTWKRLQSMQDTPTSNIRSIAIGNAELVGQVRNGIIDPPLLHVDGDHSKTVADLVSWNWEYEIEVEQRRMVRDSNGNMRQEVSRHWRSVRTDEGGTNFTLHDGTGGIMIVTGSFRNDNDFGEHLIQWECNHNRNLGNLFGNIFSMFVADEKILRHRWTLWGLKLGDPCYVMGMIKPRTNEEMSYDKQVDTTLQNSIVYAVGEKSPGFKPRLEKGTELTAISSARSQLENIVFPIFGLIIGIAQFLI
ncbi:MAG: hypothetical protein NZ736_07880 [Candidatus Poseidoniaceae archaeon]|nr:hypothetical protein [Candidatus Poseidoniaceae archaeon]